MKTTPRLLSFRMFATLLTFGVVPAALAANWPSWRGPAGDGTAAAAKNLPDAWSAEKNIKWKVAMPAWSGSSPSVWGDRIFLNTPSKQGAAEAAPAPVPGKKARPRPGGVSGPGGQEIMLVCLDRATGKELWQRQYDRGNDLKMKHNMSSPTPVTDGKHVWVVSGNGMVACFDFAGNQRWTFDIPKNFGKIGVQFGYGSSPLLVDGKLVFQMLQGFSTDEPCYLFALNAADGKTLWRVERPTDAEHESPDSYSTPALLTVDGKKQVVVGGSGYVTGHDLATGAELWRGGGLNPTKSRTFRVISSPLVSNGMIFTPTRVTPFIAYKAGGKGDITETHQAWQWTEKGAPDVPTVVSDGERLYMVDDQGAFTCLDAKTGARIYGPEQTGIGRTSASPVLADGKIYIISETAETAVVQAGPTFKLLGKSTLDGSYTLCTPAFVDGAIILRTGTHLYCISK